MRQRVEILVPCLPAALLLLFAGQAGTLAGAATGEGAAAGHLALLLCLIAAGRSWRDPLGLGKRGNLLLMALLASVFASWLLSPVPRAGRLALLAAAFLSVPRAVAWCWSTAERRRQGMMAVSAVFTTVAAWSLIDAAAGGTAAVPLGHHNLLAAWLVAVLPLALRPWSAGRAGRLLALAAGSLGAASLIASRSLSAAVTVGVVAVVASLPRFHRGGLVTLGSRAPGSRRGRIVLAVAAVLLLFQLPRLIRLADFDSSAQARIGYFEAGWRGLVERPVLGWGPGSTAWTIAEHLRPRPGVHPPDEIVGDLHSLPLQLGYELGLSGLLLAIGTAVVFVRRRRSEAAADPHLLRAAALGLLALATIAVAGLPLAVTALPIAAATLMGAALAASGAAPPPAGSSRWPAIAVAIAIAAAVFPSDLAQRAYDRAATGRAATGRAGSGGVSEDQARSLRRAVRWDPAFPRYRARLAWLDRELGDPARRIAERARDAASDAHGIAPLWMVAGALGQETGEPWSREALLRACRLNPLGALAPFFLAVGEPEGPLSPEWGARALLADPRLLAASAWRDRRQLLAAAVAWAARVEGVDEGWRLRLRETFARGLDLSGETRELVLKMDGAGEKSMSLHAFRRRPWAAGLGRVDLHVRALEQIDLVSVSRQPATAAEVFDFRGFCALAEFP